MEQKKDNRYVLHLVNHNYKGKILPQRDFNVLIELQKKPLKVYAVSPDFNGKKDVKYDFNNGVLKLKVDNLKYYNVISIEME